MAKVKFDFSSRRFLWIFFFVNVFFASYFIDTWTTPNSVSRALPVLTFWEEGTLKINTYQQYSGDKSKVGEDYYSDKAPFPTFVMIPVYGTMRLIGLGSSGENAGKRWPIEIWPGGQDGRTFQFSKIHSLMWMSSFLLGSLPFAFLVWLSFFRLEPERRKASILLLVLLSWYGSFVFVFGGTFFNHVLSGALLTASYYFLLKDKNLWISGALLGAAFLSEYTLLLAFPFWMAAAWLRTKKVNLLLSLCLGISPFIVTILWYNFSINGNPFKMLNAYHAVEIFGKSLSQNYGFSLSNLSVESIWGLSFSPYMGIFWFCPLLFLGLWYWIKDLSSGGFHILHFVKRPAPLFAWVFFMVMASFFTWWGGWSFGPRYLIPIACLLIFETINFLTGIDYPRWAVWALGIFGVIQSWMAKSTLVYMCPDASTQKGPAPAMGSVTISDFILPAFRDGKFNGNNLLSAIGVEPAFASFFWLILFSTLIYAIWMSRSSESGPEKRKKTPVKVKGKKKA